MQPHARAAETLGVIYVAILGIPAVLLVMHLLMVLGRPSEDTRERVVQSSSRR